MSKGAKIWLIVAAALVLVGCIAFAVVMTALKWNFSMSPLQETARIAERSKIIIVKKDTIFFIDYASFSTTRIEYETTLLL